jgi:hypothetical protein
MERSTVWAVIGEDVKLQRYKGEMIHPRGVIGYLVSDGADQPVLFVAGGIATPAQPEFNPARIMAKIGGLLLRPITAKGEPDTSNAARSGAMFVNGQLQVMDLADFKAAMDRYYSRAARMPARASTRPGVGFRSAQIKSGLVQSPLIHQLAGIKDRRALASQAA